MADERKKLSFDPTINAGHLLTFVGFIVAGFVGWSTLDKRLVVVEEARKAQVQTDQHQDTLHRASIDAVRDSLREIKEGVQRLNDRMDRREGR